MSQQLIPNHIVVEMTYRNNSNFRRSETFKITNDKKLCSDIIREAFNDIGVNDIVPMQWLLPSLSPLSHPDEPTNDLDHCYMEIAGVEFIYDGQYTHYDNTHDNDISEIVDAVNNGGSNDYKKYEELLKKTQIDEAKALLLASGYTVTSPNEDVSVLLFDETNNSTTTAVIDAKSNCGLAISFSEHGDCCSQGENGTPVYIERIDGDVRVVIYSDINKEDPTHTVSLKDALLSNRQE